MTDDQADEVISLLTELLEEMRGMRTDFLEFTGYNVDRMSAVTEQIVEGITGRFSGMGGADLGEVKSTLDNLQSSVDGIDGFDADEITGRGSLGKFGKNLEDIHAALVEQTLAIEAR